MFDEQHTRRRFERSAAGFDEADFVHSVTRQGLLDRIEPLLVDASTVLDLGTATGGAHRALHKRFPKARVVALDVAHNMLQSARDKKGWFARTSFLQADACALPFAAQSVDVIFCNQLLPWIADLDQLFREVARVLRVGGVFAFATLGPDSLQEIRRAWRSIDEGSHVSPFPDMHNLGDGLVNAGLADPVLDVDRLAVSYSSTDDLLRDLTVAAARNSLRDRSRQLTGKRRFAAMLEALGSNTDDGKILLELELVFGHCWGVGAKKDPQNYRIDAGHIPIRKR